MIEVRKNSDGQVLGPRTERRTYDCQQMGWDDNGVELPVKTGDAVLNCGPNSDRGGVEAGTSASAPDHTLLGGNEMAPTDLTPHRTSCPRGAR